MAIEKPQLLQFLRRDQRRPCDLPMMRPTFCVCCNKKGAPILQTRTTTFLEKKTDLCVPKNNLGVGNRRMWTKIRIWSAKRRWNMLPSNLLGLICSTLIIFSRRLTPSLLWVLKSGQRKAFWVLKSENSTILPPSLEKSLLGATKRKFYHSTEPKVAKLLFLSF
jgi:hypothetical protein